MEGILTTFREIFFALRTRPSPRQVSQGVLTSPVPSQTGQVDIWGQNGEPSYLRTHFAPNRKWHSSTKEDQRVLAMVENTWLKIPRGVRTCCTTFPAPPQREQEDAVVPGLTPEPVQVPQVTRRLISISELYPNTASRKSIWRSYLWRYEATY